jgi:tetratricopeptide (TPR) repeat protein
MLKHLSVAICASSMAICVPATLDAQAEPSYPPEFSQPIPLYTRGLGIYEWKITTRSAEAQKYFNQGVQLMYAFATDDAARSFREAWKRDSTCAMCYWGEAWAWGPYLNEAMATDDPPRAAFAAERAVALRANATKRERAQIDAMAVRYKPTQDSTLRKQLDSAYARVLEAAWKKDKKDAELGTMYGEALMLLEPRRGYWSLQKSSIGEIHRTLEHILKRDITHPGACHLYIHATESSEHPEKAEACAAHLGHAIPGASHLNHMPSHTYNRVGRWGDAVRANVEAWHSDQAALENEGFAVYPSHNLHMLLYAASYDGQGAVAEQGARDYAGVTRVAADSGPSRGGFYRPLVLMRFGRWNEVLQTPEPTKRAIPYGFWLSARGYAHLRNGQPDSARAMLRLVDSITQSGGDTVRFRGHPATQLLGITGGILRAELYRNDKQVDSAISSATAAVVLEDAMTYDEPEPLPFTPRHWLGALLLEAGKPAEAEKVYAADLVKHPNNGWSVYGLAAAQRAQGKTALAQASEARFDQLWTRADARIKSSRY